MGKIDTSGWKEFRVGDLFDIHPTKAYKCTNAELLDGGDTNVVVNSAYDNGIGGTSTFSPTENGNMITFSDTVDANTIFYQKSPFVGYPHVQGLYPVGKYQNAWTQGSLQYFVTVFRERALAVGFDYGNKFRRDIAANLFVKLPATPDGAPDWAYMESYMANIETKVAESLTLLQAAKDAEKKKVDTREWGGFRVGELFDIHPTKAYKCTNAELLDNGETHVVVNSAYNNGVGGLSTLKPTEQGNMITFSDTVDANTIFYQDKPFIGYPHVQGLYPIGIFRKNWTELSLKYFATVFRQKALSIGFDYGNKFRRDIAVKLYIFLPVDKTGQPDWVYMEEYMRKVEEQVERLTRQLDYV